MRLSRRDTKTKSNVRAVGIIAEYDPFHNGHAFHLQKTKEESRADIVVCVMSGDFTQRGRPALLDKWTRSRLACDNGADLVLELPFCYAAQGAETFARGAVGILEGLGVIDAIGFGSESGDIEELESLARFLKEEPEEYRSSLKHHLGLGVSFPKARELAVNESLGLDAGRLLKSPNNILAVEYLRHIASMTPVTVKRESPHASGKLPPLGDQASAGAIRAAVRHRKIEAVRSFVPEDVYQAIEDAYSENDAVQKVAERCFDIIRAVVLRTPAEELENIEGAVEGIENKIKKEIRMHSDLGSYAEALKSKRFTRTAIDRLLLHVAVGYTKEDAAAAEPYARVLAMSGKGEKLLAQARKVAAVPVVTNVNRYDGLPGQARFDALASDLYNILRARDMYENSDRVARPYRKDAEG